MLSRYLARRGRTRFPLIENGFSRMEDGRGSQETGEEEVAHGFSRMGDCVTCQVLCGRVKNRTDGTYESAQQVVSCFQ